MEFLCPSEIPRSGLVISLDSLLLYPPLPSFSPFSSEGFFFSVELDLSFFLLIFLFSAKQSFLSSGRDYYRLLSVFVRPGYRSLCSLGFGYLSPYS